MTGAAVQWMADFIGLDGPAEVAQPGTVGAQTPRGIYLVPAFVGLGAPHWDDQARGLMTGLTQSSSLAQMARATIESIAYQVRDVFDEMQSATGGALHVLLADGGVTRNDQLMQFQADILGVPVQRNNTPEVSAMGAAYLAGLAVGVWSSTEEIAALPRSIDRFEPRIAASERERLYDGWRAAVSRTLYRPAIPRSQVAAPAPVLRAVRRCRPTLPAAICNLTRCRRGWLLCNCPCEHEYQCTEMAEDDGGRHRGSGRDRDRGESYASAPSRYACAT